MGTLVTFKRDFSVPPYRKNKIVKPQLHYCFDDTVELEDDEKQRIDNWAKELDEEKPYSGGEQFLKKSYIGPRVDSPSADGKPVEGDKVVDSNGRQLPVKTGYQGDGLDDLSLDQLKSLASDEGIDIKDLKTRAALREAVRAKRS